LGGGLVDDAFCAAPAEATATVADAAGVVAAAGGESAGALGWLIVKPDAGAWWNIGRLEAASGKDDSSAVVPAAADASMADAGRLTPRFAAAADSIASLS
jgi:hypothetical protein